VARPFLSLRGAAGDVAISLARFQMPKSNLQMPILSSILVKVGTNPNIEIQRTNPETSGSKKNTESSSEYKNLLNAEF
jgi:hypothetical protein